MLMKETTKKQNSQNDTNISFYLPHNTVRVFKKALLGIGAPQYIRFMINPDDMKMIMQAFDRKTFISFKISQKMRTAGNGESLVFRSKGFSTLIANKMGWDKTHSYRIPGKVYPTQHLVQFDLSQAEVIEYRKSPAPHLKV